MFKKQTKKLGVKFMNYLNSFRPIGGVVLSPFTSSITNTPVTMGIQKGTKFIFLQKFIPAYFHMGPKNLETL